MVNKDLGMVTAYAYAVSKGYTGTEEEFAALMADYAAVGQRAEAAATAAAASATAASGSASDSAASATAAEGFAGNASTSAGNAAQSATRASQSATAASGSATSAAGSATQAAGSATTASTKATEAAQSATAAAGSATTAGASATAAQAAQTAAEAAQTAAETAQAAAEAAAQTLVIDPTLTQPNQAAEAKATGDEISALKSQLEAVDATLITEEASGTIASFTDGADGYPMRSVEVSMEPIQDLHGQDAPYPAGGGKNKFFISVDRTAYTWSDGCGFSTISAGDSAITFNGTASASHAFSVPNATITLPSGSYALSVSVTGKVQIILKKTGTQDVVASTLSATSFTLTEDTTVDINFTIMSGASFSNQSIGFQIESGSTATAYAPYSNICPISGRTSVTVTRSGVNVWDEEWEVGGISSTTGQNESNNDRIRSKNYIPLLPSTVYYALAEEMTSNDLRMYFYDANQIFISSTSWQYSGTFTTPSTAFYGKFVRTRLTTYNAHISINYPSTDHDYHPGTVASVEVQLGQTVYGGTVDVTTGEMVVDRAMVDLGSLNWTRYVQNNEQIFLSNIADAVNAINSNVPADAYCSMLKVTNSSRVLTTEDAIITIQFYMSGVANINAKLNSVSTKEEFKAAVTGQTLCYKLITPITITLTPEQLTTVLGVNNVWSDADSVSVDYVADTKLYIQKAISAAVAALS